MLIIVVFFHISCSIHEKLNNTLISFIHSYLLQAVDTVVAGILHDVVDDTCERLSSIEREFDEDVAKLVAGVSKLSYINQVHRCRTL